MNSDRPFILGSRGPALIAVAAGAAVAAFGRGKIKINPDPTKSNLIQPNPSTSSVIACFCAKFGFFAPPLIKKRVDRKIKPNQTTFFWQPVEKLWTPPLREFLVLCAERRGSISPVDL